MSEDEQEYDSSENEESSSESSYDDGHRYRYDTGESPFDGIEIEETLENDPLCELYRAKSDSPTIYYNFRWYPGVPAESAVLIGEATGIESRFLVNAFRVHEEAGGLQVLTEPYPRTLRRALRDDGSFEEAKAMDRAVQLLLGLSALEERDVTPLVVSPESIAVWPDGVALDEYYIASAYVGGQRPVPLHRAVYLAPDMDPAEPRAADALYGLGATIFEMLTGQPLVDDTPFRVIARAVNGFEIGLPEPYRSFLLRLLAPRASERFPDARTALDALESMTMPGAIAGGDFEPMPTVVESAPSSSDDDSQEDDDRPTGPELEFAEENDQGMKVFVRRPDNVRMVLIPGGAFCMGSDGGEKNEGPAVEVEVGAFLMDETPVTWATLQRTLPRAGASHPLNANAGEYQPSMYGGRDNSDWRWGADQDVDGALAEDQPVVMVLHSEAEQLAAALGLELPSEAEWEFAYRGGTASPYYWGDEMDEDAAWFGENAERPQVVGQRSANPYGLLDMAGNVAEFCRDHFHKDIHALVVEGSEVSAADLADGVTRPSSERRSMRGGSWRSSAKALRATFRTAVSQDLPSTANGFRFVIRRAQAPDWASHAFES